MHSPAQGRNAPRSAPARRGARTAIEAIAARLREDILDGFYPPGSRLRIEELRKRYGGGTGTIREALSRLMSEALVVSEEQRGFRTAPMSLKDLRDISDMRKLLECKALSKSIEIGDVDWEARVVAAYHKLSTIESRLREGPATSELAHEWSKANEAFHEALISACGNSWLFRLRKLLHDQSQRYIRFSLINAGASRNVHEEHRAIFQAAIARDAPRACELINRHIDNTVQVISDLLGERLSQALESGA